jgi:nitroreductase
MPMLIHRRDLVLGATAAGAQAGGGASDSYTRAAAETWAPLALDRLNIERELIRAATLAANSHNTQPWRFAAEWPRIAISPDFSRRTPVVDPDDHHLWASLGCATENLVVAANAAAYAPEVSFGPDRIQVRFAAAAARDQDLAAAIPRRKSVRAPFDGRPLSPTELGALEAAGRSRAAVELILLTDRVRIDAVRDYVIAGTTAQVNDPAFVKELGAWLRFNGATAARTRDGLFSASSGNPTLPQWVGAALFRMAFQAESENEKYRAQLDSTPAVAVFSAAQNDPAHWFEAGRAAQRFCLQAAALGLSTAWVNQPVEVPQVRGQFASFLGIGARRPNLVLRVGAGGAEFARSLRRPVEAVLTA